MKFPAQLFGLESSRNSYYFLTTMKVYCTKMLQCSRNIHLPKVALQNTAHLKATGTVKTE